MYYVYILLSLKDNKFYTGRTSNLLERVNKHNRGFVKSTKNRRPLKLIYYEKFIKAKDAYLRERELKYPSAGKFKEQLRKLRLY